MSSKKKRDHAVDTKRHSAAHVMAAAVQKLWPGARFGVGPATDDGFFYDIETPEPIGAEDLQKIEKEMRRLKKRNFRFERVDVPIDEAIAKMKETGQTYKVELLELLRDKGSTAVAKETGDDAVVDAEGVDTVSIYQTGDFIDLCRGPHVDHSGQIGEFKLTALAGAYWRGDERNPQLQRIYGVLFDTKEELDHRLWQLEERKKRDHRRLGKDLELFLLRDDAGPGLPFWLPNGMVLRSELERLAVEEEHRDGYQRISTPILAKEELYLRSGHLPYYRDDMFPPLEMDEVNYFIRPMNCPHHHLVYGSRPRSYRELPLRLAEWGTVHRFEPSGTLSGLMRARGFCQNDAHIYCSHDQAKDEFSRVMKLHARYYDLLGIENYYMVLALPDLERLDKYVDKPEQWLAALDVIREAMNETGLPYEEREGEAAFYGPKIDFVIESAVGREYAISTNQLDFLATERFDLSYVGEDNEPHPVYVIHRAPLGSHERFVAFLIEHCGGRFPTWLAPTQVRLIPIADRHIAYAREVEAALRTADVYTATGGLRVDVDDSGERMQKKIRQAQHLGIPYMAIVGDREVEQRELAVRGRSDDLGTMGVDALIERLRGEIASRRDESA